MDDLRDKYLTAIAEAADEASLEDLRVAALGKKGEVALEMRKLGGMTPEERQVMGPKLNALKDEINAALTAKKEALADAALDEPSRSSPGAGHRCRDGVAADHEGCDEDEAAQRCHAYQPGRGSHANRVRPASGASQFSGRRASGYVPGVATAGAPGVGSYFDGHLVMRVSTWKVPSPSSLPAAVTFCPSWNRSGSTPR